MLRYLGYNMHKRYIVSLLLFVPLWNMGAIPTATNVLTAEANVETDDIVENYNIENGVTAAFMNEVVYPDDDYSFTKITDYMAIVTSYRKDLPSPVIIKAPATNDGKSLLLETHCNGKLVRSDHFPVGQRALEIWNLIPQTQYTYKLYLIASNDEKSELRQGTFKTEGQVRMMNIDGMYNIRDVGGWKLANGQRVKYDKIFRSGELEMVDNKEVKITEAGIHELLDVQHIGVEIDFGDYPGSRVSGQLDYYNGDAYQIVGYAGGLNKLKEQYKNCFEKVVAGLRQGKKILFHCNQGADRAGTFAFLLEGLLGVSESDLAKDYELTNFKYSGRYRNEESADHKKGYKGIIYFVNYKFNGKTLNEKIEKMALGMGISQKDINDFRKLMTEPDVEMIGTSSIRNNEAKGFYDNPEEVYDLSGRKVNISNSRLPKGIYIINGRKVVIK